MMELPNVIARKPLSRRITRRGFGASILGGLAGTVLSGVAGKGEEARAGADFTIAIIPDPQYLAESCPDNYGGYYTAMMNWIVDHRNMLLTSGTPSFTANIKAVVGVGDCVNRASAANQCMNAEKAWTILDTNGIAFTTPPGNHDYTAVPSSRSNLGAHFATGYFSAKQRAAVYGSGISLGGEDMAYWAGSYDDTGANTAVRFDISGIKSLILAIDFFAGNAAWSWAYDVLRANSHCECYITTHAWLTADGTRFQRMNPYGPDAYSMADAPYSNSAEEAWSALGINTWPNLRAIFSGHDLFGGRNSDAPSPAWFWHHVPVASASRRGQTVHQLFANSQQLDADCSAYVSKADGAGQVASVFLLSRRPALGLLEGRMISTQSADWFEARSASFPDGASWDASETLLFSVPFTTHTNKPIPRPA